MGASGPAQNLRYQGLLCNSVLGSLWFLGEEGLRVWGLGEGLGLRL